MNKKIILITGTSSGFGLIISRILSKNENFIVCASMRNLNKKDALLNEIKKLGGKVELFRIDITDINSIKLSVEEIISKFGKIDYLVNNAGQAFGGFFEDLTDEEFRIQMEVNFFGTLNMIRYVLPYMKKNKFGKIINISSISGLISFPGLGAYNASKWALDGFSESLRHEVCNFGVKIFLVEPGSHDTKIFKENARFSKNIYNEKSDYFILTHKMINNRLKNKNFFRENPENVAKKVIDIIYGRENKFRNIIGKDAKISLALKRILPFSIFEKLVRFFAYK